MIALHLLFSPVYLLMLVIYVIFIQHERGGLWQVCKLAGVVGWPLDVALNYLHVSALWGWPGNGQHTISQRLARMVFEDGARGNDARAISYFLNRLAPSGRHIIPIKGDVSG